MRIFGAHAVHQCHEFILLFVGKHPPFQYQQDFHGLLILTRGDVAFRQFEHVRRAFIFFPEKTLEQLARALQASRSHQRIAKCYEKSRVAFGRGKRFQQGSGAHRISRLDVCLGVQQRHAAFLRRQFVRAP